MNNLMSRVIIASVAVLCCERFAEAGLIPTQATITPEAGNFRWSYAVVLPCDIKLQTGDYFIVYDFAGIVPGTSIAPTGWTLSTPTVSPASNPVNVVDNSTIPNLVWTYSGPTIPTGQLGLGNFSVESTIGTSKTTMFVGHNARASDGNYDTNITQTLGPTGAAVPHRQFPSQPLSFWLVWACP